MNTATRTKPHREDLRPGEVLCAHCAAKCCRYFALPMETPTERQDFDYIRWFLLHEGATVFTEDDIWYLLMYARCKQLGADHRCAAYHTRPPICREYHTDDCEYEDDWIYDRYFETAEQVEEYAEAVLKRPAGQSIRGPRPAMQEVAITEIKAEEMDGEKTNGRRKRKRAETADT